MVFAHNQNNPPQNCPAPRQVSSDKRRRKKEKSKDPETKDHLTPNLTKSHPPSAVSSGEALCLPTSA
jgi:hypothetical protein